MNNSRYFNTQGFPISAINAAHDRALTYQTTSNSTEIQDIVVSETARREAHIGVIFDDSAPFTNEDDYAIVVMGIPASDVGDEDALERPFAIPVTEHRPSQIRTFQTTLKCTPAI